MYHHEPKAVLSPCYRTACCILEIRGVHVRSYLACLSYLCACRCLKRSDFPHCKTSCREFPTPAEGSVTCLPAPRFPPVFLFVSLCHVM